MTRQRAPLDLREILQHLTRSARTESYASLLWRSLKEDAGLLVSQGIRNSIAGSLLVPRVVRWLIYRMTGLEIDTFKVREECRINNNHVAVGAGTSLNRACYFEGSGAIRIGRDASIGPECAFITSVHDWDADGVLSHPRYLPITIGDRVWLGARVLVLPGAVVGADAVVAAGAVVRGSLRAGGVYAGVPARWISDRVPDAANINRVAGARAGEGDTHETEA